MQSIQKNSHTPTQIHIYEGSNDMGHQLEPAKQKTEQLFMEGFYDL